MNLQGLALCSRYSYPPNSLSLCGPENQKNLKWYTETQKTDKGTGEIISKFGTLYPYLKLIAQENKIPDPYDKNVIEAYWIGNNLLHKISITKFVRHLSETIELKKKMEKSDLEYIFKKIGDGALPHHSFHVLNVYKRTGHLDIPHTVETMDACIINVGRVEKIGSGIFEVDTKPLRIINGKLAFGQVRKRDLMTQGDKDILVPRVKVGDWISYHWGYFCDKLYPQQVQRLSYYTNWSLKLANSKT